MFQTITQKIVYSFLAALLFLGLSYINNYYNKCFEVFDLLYTLLFFILFLVLIFIIDQLSRDLTKESFSTLLKYSFYATLLYYFVSSPQFYQLINYIPIGILDKNHCPTFIGNLVNAIIFMILIFATTFFPN